METSTLTHIFSYYIQYNTFNPDHIIIIHCISITWLNITNLTWIASDYFYSKETELSPKKKKWSYDTADVCEREIKGGEKGRREMTDRFQ